jgi:hypothetical protein
VLRLQILGTLAMEDFTFLAICYTELFRRNGMACMINIAVKLGVGKMDYWFDTQDSLFDVSFSELPSNQIATAFGDESIKLFDITSTDLQIQQWRKYTLEVFSLS